jgi:hypothetical protein
MYIPIFSSIDGTAWYCAFAFKFALVVTQKIPFSKILEVVVSRPEFAQDHESGLRSDRGPVVLCDFSKLRFWKSPYNLLNLYGRFCPYNPPYKHAYKPGKKKSARPLFLEDISVV